MKNFSNRLILIALLFVVGPTIHKIVTAKQQKDTMYTPISEADQSSFEEETEETDGHVICTLPYSTKRFHKQISFTIRASLLPLSLADNSFSPPPI